MCGAAVLAAGCGYVGDPLPPALNVPAPVEGLRAVQRGGRIAIEFTAPVRTTDNLALKGIADIDLRVGAMTGPSFPADWENSARRVVAPVPGEEGRVKAEYPAGALAGQQVMIAVRTASLKRRYSQWSRPVGLRVTAPLAAPKDLKAVPAAGGALVEWTAGGGEVRKGSRFEVFRQAEGEQEASLLATVDQLRFLDAKVDEGKTYRYSVQEAMGESYSEPAGPVVVKVVDTFAPKAPAGLTALAGVGSIELTWERNTEPDLKGYAVWRMAEGESEWRRLREELAERPAFGDRGVEAGKRYRYAVSAVDQKGNESARSEAVEATAP